MFRTWHSLREIRMSGGILDQALNPMREVRGVRAWVQPGEARRAARPALA